MLFKSPQHPEVTGSDWKRGKCGDVDDSCCYFSTTWLNELCRKAHQCCFAVVEINQFWGSLWKKINMDPFSAITIAQTRTHRMYNATEIYNNKIHKRLTVSVQFSSLQLDARSRKTSLYRRRERLCPCIEAFMLRFYEAKPRAVFTTAGRAMGAARCDQK